MNDKQQISNLSLLKLAIEIKKRAYLLQNSSEIINAALKQLIRLRKLAGSQTLKRG